MRVTTSNLRVLILGVLLVSFAYAADSPDVHKVADAVDAHYNHLQSLQSEFSETYRGSGNERVESGTLWLKKPGKMRWEYRSPREKLFLSDGKDAWFYVPGDRQARKTPVRKLDDLRSPLGFLLGKTKLEKELQGLSLATDLTPKVAGRHSLKGHPQSHGRSGKPGNSRDCARQLVPAHRSGRGGWLADRIFFPGSERERANCRFTI